MSFTTLAIEVEHLIIIGVLLYVVWKVRNLL